MPVSPMTLQDGIRAVQTAFTQATPPPRFPMYVRQAKQYLRNAIAGFDERKYGVASVVDLLRAAGKEGVLRIERDRQGAVRIFPGPKMAPPMTGLPVDEPEVEDTIDGSAEVEAAQTSVERAFVESVTEPPIVDAEPVAASDEPEDGQLAVLGRKGVRKRTVSTARPAKAGGRTKTARPRARKSSRAKSEAAKTG